MKCYDSDKSATGYKPFDDKFKLNVKGRGKSRKRKMELASLVSFQDEDEIIVDPEATYYK